MHEADARRLRDLSVVVLSHNRMSDLERLLSDLVAWAPSYGFEILVVDNLSQDGSREYLESLGQADFLRVLIQDENLGVARGRNIGWNAASRSFVLNLDDDTVISIEAMAHLVDYMQERPRVGLAFPRVCHYVSGREQTGLGHVPRPASNYHGACHIVRKEAFLDVGELDDECAFGGEELDYSIRIRTANWLMEFVPSVLVHHNSQVRIGAQSEWRRKQWVFNYVRVLYKHLPLFLASKYSTRVLISHLVSGVRASGAAFAFTLIFAAMRGARSGRLVHSGIPAHVLAVYSSRELEPDFGNIPIFQKLLRRRAVK